MYLLDMVNKGLRAIDQTVADILPDASLFVRIFLDFLSVTPMLTCLIKLRKDKLGLEPFWSVPVICIRRITAPFIIDEAFDEASSKGISVDIIGELQEIRIVLHKYALISALKQMAVSRVSPIEACGIGCTQPLHTL